MKKTPTVLISLTALSLLMAGCAPAAAPPAVQKAATSAPPVSSPKAAVPVSTPAPPGTPKPAAPMESGPRKGGILNKATKSEPPHFDLQISGAGLQLFSLGPAYSGLVQYDPQKPGVVAPDLAQTWTASPDGLSYTFKLRPGVKWHDGSPLTGQDIKLSMERLKKQPQAGPGMEALRAVETPDEQTVRLVLEYPTVALISHLALATAAIMPKHVIDKKGSMRDDVVGTGAFKFKAFNRGSSMDLERNPNYFIPDRPYLDGIRTYYIGDESTSLSALRTGRIDFLINPSDAGAMTIKEKFKEATPGQMRQSQWRAIYLPLDKPPFNDIRVRKAVHLAVDRQAAIKVIMGGMAELGSVIPEGMGGIPAADLEKRPGYRQPKDQDIAEAKRLLAEAGFPSGLKTSTLHQRGTAYDSAAVFMKDQLAKIGIELALETADDATVFELRQKRAYNTFTHRRAITAFDPDAILMQEYKTGVPYNWSNVSDAELDRLIDLQSREQDREKRKALVRQANERIEELATTVILSWAGYWRIWGPRVRNFVLPAANYDDEKMVDVWLAR
ncbi:MAG: hypothetical protein HYX92_12435 [Chloroflexi bacterium]|nr:hypothetical protein [Chloroflexota bacterium]